MICGIQTEENELVEVLCEVCPSFLLSTIEVATEKDSVTEPFRSPKKSDEELQCLKSKIEASDFVFAGQKISSTFKQNLWR